jgi:hypothetical protein
MRFASAALAAHKHIQKRALATAQAAASRERRPWMVWKNEQGELHVEPHQTDIYQQEIVPPSENFRIVEV